MWLCFFFFNDTATTEIYTLSLHDALPISGAWPTSGADHGQPAPMVFVSSSNPARKTDRQAPVRPVGIGGANGPATALRAAADRKSTRLNSSHANISYAVFCLKKKINIATS